jgi:hypothetical protein
MTAKTNERMGRPPDGIKRRNMTISLPVVVTDRIRQYRDEHGETGSNLIARLLAEFFRTDGKPPGNVRATLKAKLAKLE